MNRLAAAGLLLMIIHELPSPADDLVQQGEELANFIRKQQRADGSLHCTDNPDDPASADLADGTLTCSGAALYGVMLSHRNRPATWKLDLVRRAMPFYRSWWKDHPRAEFVSWQSAAYAEAYLAARDPACAAFVFEMNDWLCSQQFTPTDARQASWVGGFKGPVGAAPTTACAALVEGLVEACRLTRQVPDAARFERYRNALGQWAQFLTSLQYAEDNTRHFAQSFRPLIMGGFHTSTQDGNLLLASNSQAVSALVEYLAYTAAR